MCRDTIEGRVHVTLPDNIQLTVLEPSFKVGEKRW